MSWAFFSWFMASTSPRTRVLVTVTTWAPWVAGWSLTWRLAGLPSSIWIF